MSLLQVNQVEQSPTQVDGIDEVLERHSLRLDRLMTPPPTDSPRAIQEHRSPAATDGLLSRVDATVTLCNELKGMSIPKTVWLKSSWEVLYNYACALLPLEMCRICDKNSARFGCTLD